MTISSWLKATEQQLFNAGIETARLDAVVLLSDQLGRDKSWIFAYSEEELQRSDLNALNTRIAQRSSHMPLAYIREHVEFYRHDFIVNPHVLIPRPESESMLTLLLQLPIRPSTTLLDVGTGSGALAVSAKKEMPSCNVVALDIDPDCLELAMRNAKRMQADIRFIKSDLLEAVVHIDLDPPIIVLANLPYVPQEYPINRAASFEPKLALYSGVDGLDHYRRLLAQINEFRLYPEVLITECLVVQQPSLEAIAAEAGYILDTTEGLAQLFRRRIKN